MKYTLSIEGDHVELWGFGIKLIDDEARRVIRHAAEHFGVTEGIPLQDPAAPAYGPYATPHEQETHTERPTVIGRG